MLAAEAQEIAQQIHKDVESRAGEPVQLGLPIAPLPTDLCRVSPFYPLDKDALAHREYFEDLIITETSWGRISYTGPKLSTYDEDCLLGMLALLDEAKHRHKSQTPNGETTYTYKGPLLPLLRLMGLNTSQRTYDRVRRSLKRMTATALELEIYKRSTSGKRKVDKRLVNSILSAAYWDEEKKTLIVTINSYFYEAYNQGFVTRLDMLRRVELKSPIAKSLYRFVQSHRDDRWQGHYLTLATSLNLEETLPNYKKKDRIRAAVKRLQATKLLTKKSGFHKDNPDVVVLVRSKERPGGKHKALPTAL